MIDYLQNNLTEKTIPNLSSLESISKNLKDKEDQIVIWGYNTTPAIWFINLNILTDGNASELVDN